MSKLRIATAPLHMTPLVNKISTSDDYYDASVAFRDRAMRGLLHSE